jgi:hypothetical protein
MASVVLVFDVKSVIIAKINKIAKITKTTKIPI